MTERRDDAEIARLQRRLREAETELAEVRRGGEAREPLLARLAEHLEQNQFAARLFASMEQSRRAT